MRQGLIFNILGLLLKYTGFMFLIPVVAALFLKEYNEIYPYIVSALLCAVLSFLFSLNKTNQKDIDNIKKSESLVTVLFAWILFGLMCTIPYLFYDFSLTNAVFESVSGITTTGATTIQNFALYPKTLFFFRSLTQWFGGMGIVVLFIAVLPKIAVAGRKMFYAEIPAPTEDKATPRIRYTASWLWGIYLALTILETLCLKFFGLDTYDAVVTSISTTATGGFSPLPNSIMDFHNSYITFCIMLFMFIAGINYILIYRSLRSKKLTPFLKSEEFKVYVFIIIFVSVLLALSLFFNSHYELKTAFLNSFFEIISTVTSTGFAIDNFINWDAVSKVILFGAFFIGGCATSTSGGIKVIRWIFLAKYLKREMNKILHPSAVYPIKLENHTVDRDVVSQIMAFLVFYFLIFGICSFLVLLIENNTTIALSSCAAAIGNIGPGFGAIGPMDSFTVLQVPTRWILVFLMLVGRLEIIPFLAILNKDLWRN